MSSYQERGGNWSPGDTELLLEIWGQAEIQKEMLVSVRNLETYNHVSSLMQERRPTFRRNGLQCRYRIKRLKREYRRAKEKGTPYLFAFYDQMDKIFAERSKFAEWHEKMKVKKKMYPQDGHATDSVHDAPSIKIEIDNAEDYKHALSGYSFEHATDHSMAGGNHDTGSADTDGDDQDDSIDGQSDSQDGEDMNIAHEEEMEISRDARSSGVENYSSEPAQETTLENLPESSAKPQLSMDSEDQPSSPMKPGSTTGDHQSESESSPPPFVITSVCHVESAESLDSEHEGSPANGASESVKKDSTSALKDSVSADQGPTKTGLHSGGDTDDSRSMKEMNPVQKSSSKANSGEENNTSQADVTSQSQGLDVGVMGKDLLPTDGATTKVAAQVEKDLQIIAEWNITDPQPLLDEESVTASNTVSCVSVSEKKQEDEPDPVASKPAHKVTVDTSTPVTVAMNTASRPAGHLTDVAVKPCRRPRFMLVEAGAVHTLVKIPDIPAKDAVSDAASSRREVPDTPAQKPVRSILPRVTLVSSGMSTVLKPGVSLLSSSQRPQNLSSATVPQLGRPPSRGGSLGAAQYGHIVSSKSPSTHTQSKTIRLVSPSPILIQKRPEPTTNKQPIFVSVTRPSYVSSAVTLSIPVRKLLEARKTTVAQKMPLTLTSSATLPDSKPALTFTTLSSVNPVPKKQTVTVESQPSSSFPVSSASFMIPHHSRAIHRSGLAASALTPTTTTITRSALFDLKDIKTEDSNTTQKQPYSMLNSPAEGTHCEADTDRESSEDTSGLSRIKAVQEALYNKLLSLNAAKKRKLTDAVPATESANTASANAANVDNLQQSDTESLAEDHHQANTPKLPHPEELSSPRRKTARSPSVGSSLSVASDGKTSSASRRQSPSSASANLTVGSLEESLDIPSCLTQKEEDELFRLLLAQTSLSQECQKWMLQTLADRTCSDAACAVPRGASEVETRHSGSAAEVTNLLINEGTAKSGRDSDTKVKAVLTQMAKGGVIMEVTSPEEARIAEEAGACAVMALDHVQGDVQRQEGGARMTNPKKIREILASVTIPVMARCQVGHFAEAQILEALGVDLVDESEVLTRAEEEHHMDKHNFKVPFVCGARDLGEALHRISEGAALIRTMGGAGTGGMMEAMHHLRTVSRQIRTAQAMDSSELYTYAKELRVPYDLLKKTSELGRLPVINFAAGFCATPADISLLMQLGADGVFVDSGIFHGSNPQLRAGAMVQAVTHHKDPKMLAKLSENLASAILDSPGSQQTQAASSSSDNQR